MAQINIKIDDQLKNDVSKIFNDMGLDITTGIKIYLKRVQQDRRIPFALTSNSFDAQKVAKQYEDGDQRVVNNLNALFNAIGHNNKASGSGGSILNNSDDDQFNSIGNNILKHR